MRTQVLGPTPEPLPESVGLGEGLRIYSSNESQVALMLLVWEPPFESHWLKPKPDGPGSGISPEPQSQIREVQDGSRADRWSGPWPGGLWLLSEKFRPNSVDFI